MGRPSNSICSTTPASADGTGVHRLVLCAGRARHDERILARSPAVIRPDQVAEPARVSPVIDTTFVLAIVFARPVERIAAYLPSSGWKGSKRPQE